MPKPLRSALVTALVATGLFLSACTGPDTTGPTQPAIPPAFAKSSYDSFVKMLESYFKTLTCQIEMPVSNHAVIGSAGGTLAIGRHTLIVPPGALANSVDIYGVTTGDGTASVHLYPSGLTFATPATLRLDYSKCDRVKNQKLVAYTNDDATQILETLPSKDNATRTTVDGTLTHFSRYAVAW